MINVVSLKNNCRLLSNFLLINGNVFQNETINPVVNPLLRSLVCLDVFKGIRSRIYNVNSIILKPLVPLVFSLFPRAAVVESISTLVAFNSVGATKQTTNYYSIQEGVRYSLYFQLKDILKNIGILWWRGRKWKGTWWPSKWKWYHRHGYWATRKKLLKFDKYRPYRYHEVKGPGIPKLKVWQDYRYYRPLKQSTRFW